MPAKGVSMRKIKTILRLHHESKLSQHQIAKVLQLSVGAVNKYLKRAFEANISWPLAEELADEDRLNNKINPPPQNTLRLKDNFDFPLIHQQLKRKGMTLQLLWEEYAQTAAKSVSYTHFCRLYRDWRQTQPQSMRQTHKAGDKVFVDYAGQTIDILDPDTGLVRSAQIFVGVLGASNYTYAEATWSQQLPDWIASHQRMFEFFGGVPALIVPDNLKSGVSKTCRYEPDINPTYADFIDYYGTAVLPARPGKPKDKAKVENGVLVVERWILARLRHQTFVGLDELNQAVRALVHQLNQRPFKKLPGCRESLFDSTDKPALKALPSYRYELTEVKRARVAGDYHVELDHHYYSVPHAYINQEILIRFTAQRVECWYRGKSIAVHERSYRQGDQTTLLEHMPKSHRQHLEWTPDRFVVWGARIGPAVERHIRHLLESRPHPEQGFRSCLGLVNLSKRFGDERLEKACERAWSVGARSRKSVESILANHLENWPTSPGDDQSSCASQNHENLRGQTYYH